MTHFKTLLLVSAAASNFASAGPGLDQAEVKLPYGELKALVAGSAPAAVNGPASALLSARFRLSMAADKPVIDASFRATSFADGLVMIPLTGGDVSVESQKPADARILIHETLLCLAMEKAGSQAIEARLLPVSGAEGVTLSVPASPASILETGDLGSDRSVGLRIDGREQVIGSNQTIALPAASCSVAIRMLGSEETREALRPPEPSGWSWQHQALVMPQDDGIIYQVLGRASATGGSGVSAVLGLPADAREVVVSGDDLAGFKTVRGADRSLALQLEWKSRGVLEREVMLVYQLPRRPLDRVWKLQSPAAPAENATRTRFLIAASPELSYAADGLAGPFPPKTISAKLAGSLAGESCYQLEATTAVELKVTPLPVVETAAATIGDAVWTVKLEPDGAMLLEGTMMLEYRGKSAVVLEVPQGLTLLSCEVGGTRVSPVNSGAGKLEIHVPTDGQKVPVSCSFTGKTEAFDPVEGTISLELPQTPLFIRALTWKIDLPGGYQAETHGNLVRANTQGDPPSRLTLRKNLCRDERPQTRVFYQRSDLN